MRYRTGLVSNSSSTSFLLCVSPNVTKENLLEKLGIRPGSAAAVIFERTIDELDFDATKEEKEFLSNWCCDSWEELEETEFGGLLPGDINGAKEAFEKGWKVIYSYVDQGSNSWYLGTAYIDEDIMFYSDEY